MRKMLSLFRLMVVTCVVGIAGASPLLAQGKAGRSSIPDELVDYQPVPVNLFPGFENAGLIVDYYYSTGVSLGDRYDFEIIITDRTLRLTFNSAGTPSYKRVIFESVLDITSEQASHLEQVIRTAQLVQRKNAIPRPKFSGHTREVLIVRTKDIKIGGGMFNSSIEGTDADMARERASSSTIAGDYDAVIKELRSFFPVLDSFMAQAAGR